MKNLKVLFTVLCLLCTSFAWGAYNATFTLVADVSSLSNGDSVLVVIQDGKTLTSGYAVQNNSTNYVAVTINAGAITTSAAACVWKYTIVDGLPTFIRGTQRIAWTSSTTLSTVATANTYKWYLTKLADGYYEMQAGDSNGRYIGWSGSKFAAYNNSNFKNQITLNPKANLAQYHGAMSIYKKNGSSKTSLSVPTNLSSSNVTANGATLSWDAVANASSYTVKIGSTEYTNINDNSYSATGLTASTQYTWTVKAIGDNVNYTSSDYAANANFTTSAAANYTVTWTVEGTTYSTTTDVASGSKVSALPTAPTSSCDGTFAGWVKSDNGVVGQKPADAYTTDPIPFTTAAGSPAITADTEFVAVFKKEQ